jgi:hypothetical protein
MPIHDIHQVNQSIGFKAGIHGKTQHTLRIPVSYFFRHIRDR